MGKKIFEKKCSKSIDPSKYSNIDSLKNDIKTKKNCKKLSDKHIDILTLYLWDVKRLNVSNEQLHNIELKKGDKCPVCGMFTYKYPKWAAQIHYTDSKEEFHHTFDGVKDMMKFYFSPMEWGKYNTSIQENITKILVTDYYSQRVIDATKAYYVIGSDVYGPMGDELIPFKNEDEAETFSMDHQGKKIIKFNDIVESEIYELDN